MTANAYILPDAVSLGDWAFGDEPVVIYKSERLRWVNADTVTHVIVADSPAATDFSKTDELPRNGGEQSFIMTKLGTTRIHCAIHPHDRHPHCPRTLARSEASPLDSPTRALARRFDGALDRVAARTAARILE